ncbi:MAG: cytochrome c maturation protein CcmE [Chloroflexi bacterium]|nr:cytochrome c maturation protein CcmE [Chloroflexota bacterium]
MKWIKRRKKLVISVALAIIISVAGFILFAHSETDFLTVGQVLAQSQALNGKYLRVEGTVSPGSIKWDEKERVLRFTLAGEQGNIQVAHSGEVPRDFKPGSSMLVEGRYRADSVFESRSFGSRRSLCQLCHG